jgi:hypothetical protein
MMISEWDLESYVLKTLEMGLSSDNHTRTRLNGSLSTQARSKKHIVARFDQIYPLKSINLYLGKYAKVRFIYSIC